MKLINSNTVKRFFNDVFNPQILCDTAKMRRKKLLKNAVYNQWMLPRLLEVFCEVMCELFKGVNLTPLALNPTKDLKAGHFIWKLHLSCKTYKRDLMRMQVNVSV